MIKLTYLIKKRQDLTDDAFRQIWRNTHARLVESLAPALRAKRYAMNVRAETVCSTCASKARELALSDYDGVIEIWWDSIEDHQEGAGSPAGIAAIDALVDSERRFIDFSKSACFFTEEEVIFDQTDAATPVRARGSKPRLSNSKPELSNETSFPALIK